MKATIHMKTWTTLLALEAMAKKIHDDGVPWHYTAQIRRVDQMLTVARLHLGSQVPIGLHVSAHDQWPWVQVCAVLDALADAAARLCAEPLHHPEITAAVIELVPFLEELETERDRLAPDWFRVDHEPTPPAGYRHRWHRLRAASP